MSKTWALAGAALSLLIFAGSARAAGDPHDLGGVWMNTAPTARLAPDGGGAAPLNAAGRAAFARVQADLKSGKAVDTVRKYCLPEGVPRLMSSPYPLEIIQAQNQVNIIHELHHTFRVVLMEKAHPPEDVLVMGFMGDSVGHWDGPVLVIDTVGFNASAPLDAAGLPHGEKLHIVERLHKTVAGLQDDITIEDPEFYARPWTVTARYRARPDLSIQEYACGEPHRPLPRRTRP